MKFKKTRCDVTLPKLSEHCYKRCFNFYSNKKIWLLPNTVNIINTGVKYERSKQSTNKMLFIRNRGDRLWRIINPYLFSDSDIQIHIITPQLCLIEEGENLFHAELVTPKDSVYEDPSKKKKQYNIITVNIMSFSLVTTCDIFYSDDEEEEDEEENMMDDDDDDDEGYLTCNE